MFCLEATYRFHGMFSGASRRRCFLIQLICSSEIKKQLQAALVPALERGPAHSAVSLLSDTVRAAKFHYNWSRSFPIRAFILIEPVGRTSTWSDRLLFTSGVSPGFRISPSGRRLLFSHAWPLYKLEHCVLRAQTSAKSSDADHTDQLTTELSFVFISRHTGQITLQFL